MVQLGLMKSWLLEHDVPHDSIEINGKAMAHIYVDDRGLYFHQSAGLKIKGYEGILFDEIKKRMEITDDE